MYAKVRYFQALNFHSTVQWNSEHSVEKEAGSIIESFKKLGVWESSLSAVFLNFFIFQIINFMNSICTINVIVSNTQR